MGGVRAWHSVAMRYKSFLAPGPGAALGGANCTTGRPQPVKYFLGHAAAALAFLVPGLSNAALPPAGSRYQLTVKTSFEPTFSDCWTFSSAGTFIHSPSLHNFPYQLDNLNKLAGNWQAIWVGHVSIAFAGTADGTAIAGNAVDALSRTYSITGKPVSSCGTNAQAGKGWPTGRP